MQDEHERRFSFSRSKEVFEKDAVTLVIGHPGENN